MPDPVLGVVADDLTGAADLAGTLVGRGVATSLHTAAGPLDPPPGTAAMVVALKSRTAPVAEAVERSLDAWHRLAAAGAARAYFKYCSTFDSTPEGNIGPVSDALADATGEVLTVACPSFPANARTVYQGRLFVGGVPLDESPMAHHPLTPMTDADLVRWLGHQTDRTVALLPYQVVTAGPGAIRNHLVALADAGAAHAVADALDDGHLAILGEALADRRLVTGGSALAGALAAAWQADGTLPSAASPPWFTATGPAAVVAGSCSAATRAQLAAAASAGAHVVTVDPLALAADRGSTDELIARAIAELGERLVVVAASADPDAVRRVHDTLGRARSAALVEDALARAAAAMVGAGAGRLIVAGGETSGAVIERLGVPSLRIGAEIAPGVPMAEAVVDDRPVVLVLKSGNFGGPAFFMDAAAAIGRR